MKIKFSILFENRRSGYFFSLFIKRQLELLENSRILKKMYAAHIYLVEFCVFGCGGR